MNDIVGQWPSTSPEVHKVMATLEVPGRFITFGIFLDYTDAFIFKEQIKYEVESAKIKTIDRRV